MADIDKLLEVIEDLVQVLHKNGCWFTGWIDGFSLRREGLCVF